MNIKLNNTRINPNIRLVVLKVLAIKALKNQFEGNTK
jgi:hypothetical protein